MARWNNSDDVTLEKDSFLQETCAPRCFPSTCTGVK